MSSLGLSSYARYWTVRGRSGAEACRFLIDDVAGLDLRVVQLADNVDLIGCSEAELASIRQRATRAEVVLETGTRGLQTSHLLRHVQIAGTLGARLLRLVPGEAGHARLTGAELAAALAPVIDALARAGVTLAIENHSTVPDQDLADCVRQLDSPWVGVCLDTANSVGLLEKPVDTVARLAPHARCVHLKDFVIEGPEMGYQIRGAALGEGDLPLEDIAKLLAACPHRHNTLLELWVDDADGEAVARDREEDWVRRSVDRARRLTALADDTDGDDA